MRTWEITQILQFTVLTNVDVNGSQIVKVYCYWTMKCLNVLSLWKMYFHLPCQRNVWQDSQTLFMLNNNSSILNMTAQALSRDRRGTRDHIGHLISVRAVPALGTSLFVVSAYLHAQRGGALQRPGKIYPNQHTCNSRSFRYYKWTRSGRYWTSAS